MRLDGIFSTLREAPNQSQAKPILPHMKPALGEKLAPLLAPYPTTRHYLIGVSGGRDSVALLHLLLGMGYKRLTVCHLDHGLRGRASRADARFVERLAQRCQLPAVIGRAEVGILARESKQSIETAARHARRRFFADAARRSRCRTIFLAHHADDQVETFLFNLFRGSGPAGLAGMRLESSWPLDPPARGSLRAVRPLLGVWRSEIDEYIRAESLPFREDASNADPAHTRNRMRGEIIPALETAFGRGIKTSLWRAADLLAADEDWLTGLLAAEASPTEKLSTAPLLRQPIAKQRRMLRAWLAHSGAENLGYEAIERVRSLLDIASGPAKVNLPGDWHARRRGGWLFIEKSAIPRRKPL
jgi:tRNA(Ile)-lysidine synthase